MTAQPHLRILMATLNGADHLGAQLASIRAQTYTNWSLWISDDGSTDATREIVENFRSETPDHDLRLLDGPARGTAQNFFSLLSGAQTGDDAWVAFADQDDVWLPEKLSRAVTALSTALPGPAAYGAAARLSDADLRATGQSHPAPRGPAFANALLQNVLGGHSLVLNPEAAALLCQAGLPEDVPFHDWWAYLLLSGAGAQIICDPEPALIYRGHDSNLLGPAGGTEAKLRRARMLGRGLYRDWISANLDALIARQTSLTPENRALLADYVAARANGRLRQFTAQIRLGLYRQTRAGTWAVRCATLFGKC